MRPAFKLWFEINGEYVFGEGTYRLLERINEEGSLSAAAKALGMSYRYAWGLVKNVEEHLGKTVAKTRRGGKHGGKTELTREGLSLVENYRKLRKTMSEACKLE